MSKTSTDASVSQVGAPSAERVRRRRRPTVGTVTKYVLVAILMLIFLFPLAFLINTALKSDAGFNADPMGITKTLEFGNFAAAWQQGNFGAYILNSVLYAGVSALLGTAISLLIGFPVSRGYIRHSKFWYGLFVVMLFLPNALITQFQLALRLGIYDTQLGYILLMGASVGIGPLLVSGYVKSIPVELDEAAALDGVPYWRYLLFFIPQLIKPVLATAFLLQAIGVWNDIVLATILLPDPAKYPVTLGLFTFQGGYTSQWGLLAAATIIVAAPLVIGFIFFQRYLVGGVLGGAVKG